MVDFYKNIRNAIIIIIMTIKQPQPEQPQPSSEIKSLMILTVNFIKFQTPMQANHGIPVF